MSDLFVHRAVSGASFSRLVRAVADDLRHAREAGTTQMLVLAKQLAFAPPTISERHEMARIWAAAAASRVTVAVVCPAEMIDEHKFGVLAARNFGLSCDVFSDEDEARAWLAAQQAIRGRDAAVVRA